VLKRSLDIALAFAGLVLLAPVLLFLAIAVRLSSSGPAFYRGVRVGLNGKLFRIVKLRSMVVNADALGASCTSASDPRITPTGRWLRKYKIDELPQLFNVLKGDMSLVGPRPEVERYAALFNEKEKQILSVRPGITDWATLSNSDEEAILAGRSNPEQAYLEEFRPEKIRLQLKYVRERNLWIDFRILLATVILVLKRCFGGRSPDHPRIQHFMGRES
jgi:lipopolysaccharide/colanic/teichoic acid biosynthesis glycosyltransferase